MEPVVEPGRADVGEPIGLGDDEPAQLEDARLGEDGEEAPGELAECPPHVGGLLEGVRVRPRQAVDQLGGGATNDLGEEPLLEYGPADAPAVVHVYGASAHRAVQPSPADIAEVAGGDLRVIVFDRRGRGESGDTEPYAVQREIADIAALVDHAGGRVVLLGESSGGVLALEAARAGLPVDGVVMFEPGFVVDDQRPPVPADYLPRLDALIAEGRREDALKLFTVESVGIPEEYLGAITTMPTWEPAIQVARTLRYDGRIMDGLMAGDPTPLGRYADVTVPVLREFVLGR